MADAFRGLTIKIGADDRKLQSALSSISRSASAAQKQLRMMQNALKVDGTNATLLGNALDLANDKVRLTARSAQTVATAIKQAEGEVLKFSKESGVGAAKIKTLSASFGDIYATTQKVNTAYNRTNKELQMIYDAAKKAAVADPLLPKIKTAEQANKFVNALRRNLDDVTDKGKNARATLESLVRIAATSGELDVFGLGKTFTASKKMVKLMYDLRSQSNLLGLDLQNLEKVEGFRAMQYRLEAFKVELAQAAEEAVKFELSMQMVGNKSLAKVTAEAKRLDNVIDESVASVRRMSEAYEAMPASQEAAYAKLDAFKSAEHALNMQIENTKKRLKEIENTPGFDKLAATSKTVYTNFEELNHKLVDLRVQESMFNAEIEETSSKLVEVENILRNDPKNTQALADYKKFNGELSKSKANLENVQGKIREVGSALAKANLAKEWNEDRNALIGYEAELEKLNASMSKLESKRRIMQSLRTMGYGLYSTITPALMITGRYAIQAANDIDSAYRNMRKTVNGTEEDFEHLKDAAIEFSRTHVTTADTILEIEALGGQLGIQSSNLEAFSEVISNLDIATDIDSEELATYVGQLSNIMNDMRIHKDDPVAYKETITSFSDALVRLGNNSAAQESNIMRVMMRIASLGTISGFTTPELLAIADAVAATGQGAEAAGTAISKTFSNIEAAVGAGGDKLAKFAQVAGMSAEDFAESWGTTPIEAFTAFIGGLKKIDQEGGSVDSTLSSLGITSVRQKQALMGLTQTYDVLTGSLDMANDAWNGLSTTMSDGSIEEAGDAAREAQRKSEGFSGELQIMKNNAVALAEELAQGALPFIQVLGDMFEYLTGAIKEMPDGLKTAIIGFAGFVALLGPALVSIGAVGSGILSIKEVLTTLAKTKIWSNLTKGLTGLRADFAFIGNMATSVSKTMPQFAKMGKIFTFLSKIPVGGWVTAAIAIPIAIKGIADAYQEAIKKQERFENAGKNMIGFVKNLGSSAGIMSKGFDTSAIAIERLRDNMGKYSQAAKDAVEKSIALTESWTAKESDARTNAVLIQHYSDIITELAGNCEGSEGKIMKLKDAISSYNQLTGSELKLVDDYTGAVDLQTEAIEANTKAAQINAYFKAYSDMLSDAIKAEAENELQIEKTAQAYADASKIVEEYHNQGRFGQVYDKENDTLEIDQEVLQAEQALTEQQLALNSLTRTGQAYSETINVLTGKVEDLAAASSDAEGFARAHKYSLSQFLDVIGTSGKDFDDFTKAALNTTGDLESFVEQLNLAGITAEDFKNIGIESFENLYKAASGDIERINIALGLLNAAGVDPVTMTVTEDGIEDVNGKLWDLDLQAGRISDGEHVFKLTASGIYELVGDTEQLEENIEELEDSNTTIDVDGAQIVDSSQKTQGLFSDLQRLNSQTSRPTVQINDDATWRIVDLKDRLLNLVSRTWSIGVTVGTSLVGHAAGGIIPAHAAGGINGIVTRPTLTNVGLTGEAGDEAIIHMRHAGGAIIPLSNRQHVRPFARAVASEMGYGGGSTTIYNVSISDFAINDDAEIRNATREYLGVLVRKGAMNVG